LEWISSRITVLFPNDTLLLVGRDADLRDAEQWLNTAENGKVDKEGESEFGALGLLPLSVPLVSRHAGKPLAELDLRNRWGVQVVEIEREGKILVSPGRSERDDLHVGLSGAGRL
jgi:K+/H+ antiporter YhaU regulatory subunit KhtT